MPPQQVQRYRKIVDHFEEVAIANLKEFLRITEFCKASAVSQRTLSRAFHAIRGTTPSHYLRVLRLKQVRQALLSADGTETVTQIAMRFGFRELGRFAGDYKTAFGERPSDTLHGRTDPSAGSGAKGMI